MRRLLGVVTKGSLTEGLEIKLDDNCSVEEIKAGKFVVVDGDKLQFFSLITDMRLDATTPAVLQSPPDVSDSLVREVLSGTATYATVMLKTMLTTERDIGRGIGYGEMGRKTNEIPERREPQPVKTVPPHFSPVYEATAYDVARVFGSEDMEPKGRYFYIGTPLDMETQVCLDLHRFVERSNGIFGKTGTGKTFLTRLILCGLVRWSALAGGGKVVTLVFDMHNEYGWKALDKEGGTAGGEVKGLRQLLGNRVAVFTLDPDSSRTRRVPIDHTVVISLDQITVDDITPLQDELRLHETAIEAAHLVFIRFKNRWLEELLTQGDAGQIQEFAQQISAHPQSLAALYRKLKRIQSLPFVVPSDEKPSRDVVKTIMDYLKRGIHVVLEFGRQSSLLAYLLVANILARRIHELYVRMTEEYLATMDPAREPRQLVIAIEEAHKFLNPQAAKQTVFGTIAREMRKYYVSLLIVDQRPSGIDDEIMSQIGTKIVAQLNDERDIQAVLTGVSNPIGLRSILASLDSKQQVLLLGHAVPMPVVVKVRDYDLGFYRTLSQDFPEAWDVVQEAEFEELALGGDGNSAIRVKRLKDDRLDEVYGE